MKIDRREEHRLKYCPHCAGPVLRCRRTRTRIIEDLPEAIIPVVILRKNCQSNRSQQGTAVQAIFISSYRTLRLRSLHPTKTIGAALKSYLQTGKLPPIPKSNPAIG